MVTKSEIEAAKRMCAEIIKRQEEARITRARRVQEANEARIAQAGPYAYVAAMAELDALQRDAEQRAPLSDRELDAMLRTLVESTAAPPRPPEPPGGQDRTPHPVTVSRGRIETVPPVDPVPSDDETESGLVASTYAFPTAEIPPAIKAASTEWIISELDRVSNAWIAGGVAPYTTVRELACQISLELNLRGGVAPRFRPMRRPRPIGKGAYPKEDSLLSNDRQVIDLHWLRCRNAKLRIENRRWDGLVAEGPFDFALASLFSGTTGSPTTKAEEILCIRTADQLELSTLQSEELRKRWSVIARGRDDVGGHSLGMKEVRRKLEDKALSVPAITPYIEGWVTLWMCYRLLGKPKGASKQLARLYSLATGKPVMDPSNLVRKLNTMAKHLTA
jgi:hypothetical protein